MKVLVVGGGGREHAIIRKIKENPTVEQIFALPGNGGMASICECVPFKATDVAGITAWAKENAIDFVVVAPDDPLVLGILQLGKHNFCTGVEGSNVQRVSICAIGNTLHFFHIVRCKLPGLFQVEFRKLPGFFPGYTLQFLEKGTVHPDGYANFFPALLTVGASSLIGRSLNCNFFHFHSIIPTR